MNLCRNISRFTVAVRRAALSSATSYEELMPTFAAKKRWTTDFSAGPDIRVLD